MIRAGIAGTTGYTGIELVKLITNHPEVELAAVTSNSYNGKALTDVFPSMRGFENLICEEFDIDSLPSRVDVMFLALPHKISMEFAPLLVDRGIKVVDLSADFRFKDVRRYEAAYQKHSAEKLLNESVYGLCEIYYDQIKKARIVGNPGCYPTSILLPLIPLLKENIISTENIISDSKSGVSGAGRSLSLTTHFSEVNESFNPYKVGNHRHTPEINEVLSLQSEKDVSITFVPHLLPLTRGMLSTIYVKAQGNCDQKKIREIWDAYYGNKIFVRILKSGMYPAISHVKGTNCCDIGVYVDEKKGQIVIVSAIDNLVKGAAGQAVQNMNIMFGLNEKTGLDFVQTPI